MAGTLGILNVGAGDTKIVFDRSNPADCIRAARVIKDMLRRGYALLAEIDQPDGTKKFQRVREFREDTFEYVIADLDPDAETADEKADVTGAPGAPAAEGAAASRPKGRPRVRNRVLDATSTRAHAVAHTAGG
jgi:hypothetical protein